MHGFPYMVAVALITALVGAPPSASLDTVAGSWQRSPFAMGGGHIIESSPILIDIDRDGQKEIIVGTTAEQCSGQGCSSTAPTLLVVMNPDGSIQWARNTQAPIQSSPATGDLDGDGDLEIVVTVGGDVADTNHDGGAIAFDHAGNQLWRFYTGKQDTSYSKGVRSSPALCDVNRDGKLEVAFGAWDQRIYLLSYAGDPLWHDLNAPGPGYLNGDSVWSSPACADLNGDGYGEIIVGADITGGGILPDGTQTIDGGFVYVFGAQGNVLVRRFLPEAIYSSPAVGDINNDGRPEIVVGTGWYWWNWHGRNEQPYVYAFSTANVFGGLPYADPAKLPDLPGWPQATDYPGFSSPALADLDDDGDLEIIIGTGHPDLPAQSPDFVDGAGSVYAWHHTGQLVQGWPVHPLNAENCCNAPVRSSPVVADVDNDGALEVLFAMIWDVQVYNANGTVQAVLNTRYTAWGSPAVGDTNGDGVVEVWIGSSFVDDQSQGYLWRFTPSTAGVGPQPWPMFHRNPQHSGLFSLPPKLNAAPETLHILYDPNATRAASAETTITLQNAGDVALNWSVSQKPAALTIRPMSGQVLPGDTARLEVDVQTAGFPSGLHVLGDVLIRGQTTAAPQQTIQVTIPTDLYIGDVWRVFLPVTAKNY